MQCQRRMLSVLIGTSLLGACSTAPAPRTATDTVGPPASETSHGATTTSNAVSVEALGAVAAASGAAPASRVASAGEPAALRELVPRTAVIVSAGVPAMTEIAAEVLRRGTDRVTVHLVVREPDVMARVLEELEDAKPDRIIAIGLPAAITARDFGKASTVFCQIFNYQDYGLISETSKGVYLLPPFELQLEAWRRLAPDLGRIGVVTGAGHDALLDEMRQAAAPFGIELHTRIVRNDREALHAFRELAPAIDGLWLLPDNRILSPDVAREMLAHSVERGKPVATFGEGLLRMGALLSMTSDPRDVVARVFERLEAVDATGRLGGPDMLPLKSVHTQINDDVAERMGLTAPAATADGH